MNHTNQIAPKLVGRRLYLRPFTVADITSDYLRWMSDPAVTRFLESRFTKQSITTLSEFVASVLADPSQYFFAIVLKEGDRHIGNIKLGPVNEVHRFGDIGIVLGEKDCWGYGYATEAISLMCLFAFETLNLHKVTAGCYANNEGSARAFKKAGFVLQGVHKDHYLSDGKYVDRIQMEMFNLIDEVKLRNEAAIANSDSPTKPSELEG